MTEFDHSGLIQKESQRKWFVITRKRVKWCFFVSLLLIGLIALLTAIIYSEYYIHSHSIRIDCNPDLPLNYRKCLARGCLWVQRLKNEPPCFYPNGYGYRSVNTTATANGYYVELERKQKTTVFGNEISQVDLHVYFETENRIRLKFTDKAKRRYEVPLPVPETPEKGSENVNYDVIFENEPQFGVIIKRLSTKTVIFDTNMPGMVYSDQFIQISTKLSSSNLYGFGERFSEEYKLNMDSKRMTFFARDYPPIDESNIYGVHPFYINIEENGDAHGVFLLNSNALEVFLQPHPSVTFRTIGGILDFYVFLGPTPEDVVRQYLEVIGFPMMPPYWSLGFQLSRYGYHNTSEVQTVMNRMLSNKIPYDVQYLDIDYMLEERVFTIDDKKFNALGALADSLHANGVKLILILDPFIASNRSLTSKYPALDEGIKRDIFIKLNGSILEANCWPGDVYYPDFSHPDALSYWSDMCKDLRKKVNFDGLWIDMNEPSSFVEGSLNGCEKNSLNYPPYPAGVLGSDPSRKLFEKTICMDADQYAGTHYNVHSLYGFFHANVTFHSLIDINNRPMVLTRSTYAGSGKYAAHWLGDNFSTWVQLRASIIGMLQFNTFGIPFVGADICGFWLNTTVELCTRWLQLGAFYPFSRNHNGLGCIDQDPPALGKEIMDVTRASFSTRYELLPYLYTLFHLAHVEGSTVARPLLHEFPADENTWNINYQFLWGPALMISPVVFEGEKHVNAYFPDGIWYDFYTGEVIKEGRGKTVTLNDLEKINLHVRGGYILPLHKPMLTANKSREQPMGLYIAPNVSDSAVGLLFWDDGIQYETQVNKKYLLLDLLYKSHEGKSELSSNVKVNGYEEASKHFISYMTLCKQSLKPSQIILYGKEVPTSSWDYNDSQKVLRLKNLKISIIKNFSLIISY